MPFTHTAVRLRTFHEAPVLGGLPRGQDGLDEDAHDSLGGVPAADNAEAQALLSGALLEHDGVEGAVAHGRVHHRRRRAAVRARPGALPRFPARTAHYNTDEERRRRVLSTRSIHAT